MTKHSAVRQDEATQDEAGQVAARRLDAAGQSCEKGGGEWGARLRTWWRARRAAARRDDGMTTSEYAVGTIAAAAFAAVLYKIVTSGAVSGALESVIGKALDAPF
ncbi:DUF4244 domain-containing protein [Streptomyces sp. NPDC002232]|uniref:DUF4244 domain-containing protein n=1 Tax=Streptomyces sp. NPDC002232 TaxID=3364640 RepID=UPI0036919DFE